MNAKALRWEGAWKDQGTEESVWLSVVGEWPENKGGGEAEEAKRLMVGSQRALKDKIKEMTFFLVH